MSIVSVVRFGVRWKMKMYTFSRASFVSIWTIVNKASLACCRYSTPDTSPVDSMANGLPNPRLPTGGNLDDSTSLSASSAVYKRGTTMPCAPESRAPIKDACQKENSYSLWMWYIYILLTIHPSFAAILTIGLTPMLAIAPTASCICQSFSS